MAAGKGLLGSYTPKMTFAGGYPVVTDSGTVADGNTILEFMPVTLGTDGKLAAVTADTIADVYGLAAQEAKAGEEAVIYLTGQFFGDALALPEGTTPADFKAPFRKLGIFLVDTENAVATSANESGQDSKTE